MSGRTAFPPCTPSTSQADQEAPPRRTKSGSRQIRSGDRCPVCDQPMRLERVTLEDGRIAVVMQDWCLRPKPQFGGMGKLAPEYREIREHLDQPEPPPW